MFLDDDETEIMMELSNSIWQQLVKELVKEIIGLTRSKLLGI